MIYPEFYKSSSPNIKIEIHPAVNLVIGFKTNGVNDTRIMVHWQIKNSFKSSNLFENLSIIGLVCPIKTIINKF